jgi:uroporphyrin-III C-methyltransferase/precorrin-2 dehydrogenase/sirohydrochlorin ferrochelatase
MAVERIGAIAGTLVDGGRDPHTPVAVIQEGTTAAQRRVDATLETVADVVAQQGVRPPAVVVIGDVVGVGPAAARD